MATENTQVIDKDMEWLYTHLPGEDLLRMRETRVKPVCDLIKGLERSKLPYTVGLFGGWGCGKTTFLSMLANDLQKRGAGRQFDIIYFNAWKYAGFMEVVPALVYKIVRSLSTHQDIDTKQIFSVLLMLGKKYSDQLGEWSEKFLGINAMELASEMIDIKDAVKKKMEEDKTEALDFYYSQIDRAQDTLEKFLKHEKQPIVVFIDELDRCDPGEAFEVIKQLRVFFAMREIPLIFILSANPEPIGLAIKHQYGLARRTNDYEAKRILEKFVDTYVDLSAPLPLTHYVKALWTKEVKNYTAGLFANIIDSKFADVGASRNMLLDVDVFGAMSTHNFLYSNLRVLEKSLRYVCSQKASQTPLLWTAWHLEIVHQIHEDLRRDIRLLAREIGVIAYESIDQALYTFHKHNMFDDRGKIQKRHGPETDQGRTFFTIYRSAFWDISKNVINRLISLNSVESRNKKQVLESMLSDPHVMDFIIIMSLLDFEREKQASKISMPQFISAVVYEKKTSREVLRLSAHFEYLLANY